MTDGSEALPVDASGFLEIGRIVKPHGLKGQVLVYPVSNRSERFAAGSLLYTSDGSKLTELCIEASSRHKNGFLVKFVGYDEMEAAEKLRGSVLKGPPLEYSEGDLLVHELIGKTLTDQNGLQVEKGRQKKLAKSCAHLR